MGKKFLFGTNLKMYKTNSQTVAYVQQLEALTADMKDLDGNLFVIPSYTALSDTKACSKRIRLGAQNMHWADCGKFTGEISPLMLKEIGVDIIELGHSERRHVMGETDADIEKKAAAAIRHGFTALLCIGETKEEKDAGQTAAVLSRQIRSALKGDYPTEKIWVAYEPVWAIGEEGIPAEPAYVEQVHGQIKEVLQEIYPECGDTIPVLYGGSVNHENCVPFANLKHVDGLFVGRSAWEAESFDQLIRKVRSAALGFER